MSLSPEPQDQVQAEDKLARINRVQFGNEGYLNRKETRKENLPVSGPMDQM